MYYILFDKKTSFPYMNPNEFMFYCYTDKENVICPKDTRLVAVEWNKKELCTYFYNLGFCSGRIDKNEIILNIKNIYYKDRNINDLAYCQYIISKNETILEDLLDKNHLYTIAKTENDKIFFPTINVDGEDYVLTYTAIKRIPAKLFKKYNGFAIVKNTFDTKCIINNKIILK